MNKLNTFINDKAILALFLISNLILLIVLCQNKYLIIITFSFSIYIIKNIKNIDQFSNSANKVIKNYIISIDQKLESKIKYKEKK